MLGIDLGTSHLVVAYMKGDQVIAHDWGAVGQGVLLPAFVQYQNGSAIIGQPARLAWQKGEPESYSLADLSLGGNESPTLVLAEQLMTSLIEKVKDERSSSQTEVEAAVITVPHDLKESQRRAIRAAARAAGLRVKRLVSQPVAAVAYDAYTHSRTEPETVLLCDMGNGSFDLTLCEVQPGQRGKVLERGTATNEYAGTFADALIAAHILRVHEGRQVSAQSLLRNQEQPTIRWLLGQVEKARLRLNKQATEGAHVNLGSDEVEPQWVALVDLYSGQEEQYELTYSDLVAQLKPLCEQASQLIRSLLEAHDTVPPRVILVGGMTKMLVVQEAIARATGKSITERYFAEESDVAVACGAALIAEGRVRVNEVLPYGIGLVAQEYDDRSQEVNAIILPKGTQAPCNETSPRFRATTDQTQSIEVKVAFGNSTNPAECEVFTHQIDVPHTASDSSIYQFVLHVDENLVFTIEVLPEYALMPSIDTLLADILTQRATRGTFIRLTTLMEEQPGDVLAAFHNGYSEQECREILSECGRFSMMLLTKWLEHAGEFKSLAIQRHLCDLVQEVASAEKEKWQHYVTSTTKQLANAAVMIADLNPMIKRQAELQRRKDACEEGIRKFEELSADIEKKQLVLNQLESAVPAELEDDLGQLRTKYEEIEQERQQLEDKFSSHLREQIKLKKGEIKGKLKKEIVQLEKQLEEVEYYAQRLDNPPPNFHKGQVPAEYREIVARQEKLRELLIGGKLRQRVREVYDMWSKLGYPRKRV